MLEAPTVLEGDEEEFTAEEIEAFEKADEDEALNKVFAHVRTCSQKGCLARSGDWPTMGFAPDHMSEEDFEMFVYDFVFEKQSDDASGITEAPVEHKRSVPKGLGIPRLKMHRSEEPREGESGEQAEPCGIEEAGAAGSAADAGESPEESIGFDRQEGRAYEASIPAGFELVELEGEMTLVPLEEDEQETAPDGKEMAIMVGTNDYYLYDKTVMTDAYARWAFLAAEDDRIATFIECVRSESRIYPRPMAAASLTNEPFSFSSEDIDEIWQAVEQSAEYPDLQRTTASNGAVYYYSTDYLSPVHAASLAEWEAVERSLNP